MIHRIEQVHIYPENVDEAIGLLCNQYPWQWIGDDGQWSQPQTFDELLERRFRNYGMTVTSVKLSPLKPILQKGIDNGTLRFVASPITAAPLLYIITVSHLRNGLWEHWRETATTVPDAIALFRDAAWFDVDPLARLAELEDLQYTRYDEPNGEISIKIEALAPLAFRIPPAL